MTHKMPPPITVGETSSEKERREVCEALREATRLYCRDFDDICDAENDMACFAERLNAPDLASAIREGIEAGRKEGAFEDGAPSVGKALSFRFPARNGDDLPLNAKGLGQSTSRSGRRATQIFGDMNDGTITAGERYTFEERFKNGRVFRWRGVVLEIEGDSWYVNLYHDEAEVTASDTTTPPPADEGFTEELLTFLRNHRAEGHETYQEMAAGFEHAANRKGETLVATYQMCARACRHLAEQEERESVEPMFINQEDAKRFAEEWRDAYEKARGDKYGLHSHSITVNCGPGCPAYVPPADDLAALKKRIGWDAVMGRYWLTKGADPNAPFEQLPIWGGCKWVWENHEHLKPYNLGNSVGEVLRRLVEHDGGE